MSVLILARHGESTYNRENRFTGWLDVPLTRRGMREAREIASKIHGYRIDVAYSSALRRTIDTLTVILQALHREQVPVVHAPELNERHYGRLQGLSKEQAAQRLGEAQVWQWRRSTTGVPPGGESLRQAGNRILAFFQAKILTDVERGMNVLVVAHGNTLRAIVEHLEGLTEQEVESLTIATGEVLVYEYGTPRGLHFKARC